MADTIVAPVQAAALYHSPDAERFAMEQRMARVFVTSGLFSDIKGQTPEQAMAQAYVKIALGNSMGFSPAESMQGIDLIQGRPAISAQLRAARMQRAGFTWAPTCTDKGCWLVMFYQSKPIMVPKVDPATGNVIRGADGTPALEQAIVSYTEADAKSAGLAGKDNYKKDPSAMYFARAITRAQRRYASGVLSGDILSREEVYNIEPEAPHQIAQPQRKSEQVATAPVSDPEPAAETATVEVTGDVIWPDRKAMNSDFLKQKQRIGDKEWERIVRESGILLGAAEPSVHTLKLYQALCAAPEPGDATGTP